MWSNDWGAAFDIGQNGNAGGVLIFHTSRLFVKNEDLLPTKLAQRSRILLKRHVLGRLATTNPELSTACEPTNLLPEKGLKKVETYSHASKDKCHTDPYLSCGGHLLFCLQVVAKGDTKEDDR